MKKGEYCYCSHNFRSMALNRKALICLPCSFHLLILFTLIYSQHCNAIDTISITQPLQDPSFLVSPGQIFKLGFFSPVNTTNRYVGVMYNVPKMPVLWVANRNKPLRDSSGVLTISEDGNLVVLDGKKEIVWSSYATNAAANSTAQLLDSGNLVLRDSSNGRNVWESFQNPTDIFWLGMRIGGSENHSIKITSWRSPSDPSMGNFTFGLNHPSTPEMFIWNRGVAYWRTGPWNGNTFIGVPEMNPVYGSRTTMVTDNAGGTYFTFDDVNNTRFRHFKISYSGVFQVFVINEKGDSEVKFPMARSECDVYGKCGPNGICDPRGSPICSCLYGYVPRDKEEWTKGNWSGGCLRKALLQCQRNNSVGLKGEGDGYLKLTNVKVPYMYTIIQQTVERECGNECSKNCSCSAYTFVVGIGCLHWADSLIDIQHFSIRGSDLYIRLAHSELDSAGSKEKKKAIVASTIAVGCLLLAALFYILWNSQIKHQAGEMMLNESVGKPKLEDLPLYSYETIANATNEFHVKNKLGEGGFGAVYKGELSDGHAIAVKRLSNSSSQGISEFMNEVTVISKLQHRNLVRILGCCVERAEKMLVYEYMPNNSLDAYLFDSRNQDSLGWNSRSVIIEGISRGLLYLHRDSRLIIIHRDLKASNILLDEELNPKISDFGLARIFGGEQDQEKTNRVVGTYGYMAPEYAMGGKFSEKSDVYSFGVLLLEIVSGKRNTSFYLDEENLSLLGFAWKMWNENKALYMAFTENLDPIAELQIERCVQVGLLCVQDSPNDRPNMSNVLSMLNGDIVDLPLPKSPVYTTTFSASEGQCYQQRGNSNNDVSLTEVQGR